MTVPNAGQQLAIREMRAAPATLYTPTPEDQIAGFQVASYDATRLLSTSSSGAKTARWGSPVHRPVGKW
jgi:hypothetical protein